MRSVLLGALLAASVFAAQDPGNVLFPAFKIIGNVYYVGTAGTACYLITSPQGHIVVNAGYETTPAFIVNSIASLGFDPDEVVHIVNSHAHNHHAAGIVVLAEMTGATRIWSSAPDRDTIVTGNYGQWEPIEEPRIFQDGDRITVGNVALTAHSTPGPTPGATTWTLQVRERARTYNVVIAGGALVEPDVPLRDNEDYPSIAADYERTFRVLRTLPCDVFLAADPADFHLEAKHKRLKADPSVNPFVDPQGYREYVDRAEKALRDRLATGH